MYFPAYETRTVGWFWKNFKTTVLGGGTLLYCVDLSHDFHCVAWRRFVTWYTLYHIGLTMYNLYQSISSDFPPPPFHPARSTGKFFLTVGNIVNKFWRKARFTPLRLSPFILENLSEGGGGINLTIWIDTNCQNILIECTLCHYNCMSEFLCHTCQIFLLHLCVTIFVQIYLP